MQSKSGKTQKKSSLLSDPATKKEGGGGGSIGLSGRATKKRTFFAASLAIHAKWSWSDGDITHFGAEQ